MRLTAPQTEKEFYNLLDAACKSAPHKRFKSSKEELDGNSSQEEFIESISNDVASFIRSNRNAFDSDDSQALAEFTSVLSVEKVKDLILQKLADEIQLVDDQESQEAEGSDAEVAPENQDDDLVSDDVMKLLEE